MPPAVRRRQQTRLSVRLPVIALLALSALLVAPAGAEETSRALVFSGNLPLTTGFTEFESSTGIEVDQLSQFPADLSPYACIFLPGHSQAFSGAQVATLSSYIDGGGRVILMGDNRFLAAVNTAMNQLLTSLGSGMRIQPDALGFGVQTTTLIEPDPLTSGVTRIEYAGTSVTDPGTDGRVLVRTVEGQPFIAAEARGEGHIALSGDVNAFSDLAFNGYTTHDNGVLASNLCLPALEPPGPMPISIAVDPETIAPHSRGIVQMTVFGSEDVAVADLDVDSLRLGPGEAEPERWGEGWSMAEDVDDDGYVDLRLKFRANETGLEAGASEICLAGGMADGTAVLGCAPVEVESRR